MKLFILLSLIVVILISLFILFNYQAINIPNEKEEAISACINLCLEAKKEITLESQCLSDLYKEKWKMEDWVCDVASWPRSDIDNLEENQCKPYLKGEVKHFVEVDRDCNLIRAI